MSRVVGVHLIRSVIVGALRDSTLSNTNQPLVSFRCDTCSCLPTSVSLLRQLQQQESDLISRKTCCSSGELIEALGNRAYLSECRRQRLGSSCVASGLQGSPTDGHHLCCGEGQHTQLGCVELVQGADDVVLSSSARSNRTFGLSECGSALNMA